MKRTATIINCINKICIILLAYFLIFSCSSEKIESKYEKYNGAEHLTKIFKAERVNRGNHEKDIQSCILMHKKHYEEDLVLDSIHRMNGYLYFVFNVKYEDGNTIAYKYKCGKGFIKLINFEWF